MSLKGKKSHATSTICTWAASLLYPSQGPSLSLKTDDALIMFLSIFSHSRGVIALLPQIVFIGKECIAEAFQGSIFIFPASISSPRAAAVQIFNFFCAKPEFQFPNVSLRVVSIFRFSIRITAACITHQLSLIGQLEYATCIYYTTCEIMQSV